MQLSLSAAAPDRPFRCGCIRRTLPVTASIFRAVFSTQTRFRAKVVLWLELFLGGRSIGMGSTTIAIPASYTRFHRARTPAQTDRGGKEARESRVPQSRLQRLCGAI